MGYYLSEDEQQRYDIQQLKGEMESMYDRINDLESKCSVFVDDIAMILEIIDHFDLSDEQKEVVKKFYQKQKTTE